MTAISGLACKLMSQLCVTRKASVLSIVLAAAVGSATASSPVVVPVRLVDHFPLVVAKIEGMDIALVFDLGDSSTVVLQQSVLDHINTVPTGESSKMPDARGNVLESPTFRVPRLQIGRAVFTDIIGRLDVHDPSYQARDVGQKGFLGTGLFMSYEVVLDYPHRTMTLVPRGNNETLSEGCRGTVVPFVAPTKWHGQPVTETDTDLGRVTVWWDTGAPTSVLSKRFVQEAQAHLTEDTVTTRRFTLGGTDFGPWRFEIWDVSLPAGFNGVIGYDFFAHHVVCVDFPGRRLLIQQ
jgi:hypothetical protein